METKLYAVGQRLACKLGDHYTRHSLAMTAEGLHKKSDIAAELAVRDAEIERLRKENADLRNHIFNGGDLLGSFLREFGSTNELSSWARQWIATEVPSAGAPVSTSGGGDNG